MNPRTVQCYNCQEIGHISANCPKAWKHFRCLNCDKAWEHAATCTSKWFDLQANFTRCKTPAESELYNQMEYQRQQLAMSIAHIREKRSNVLPIQSRIAQRLVQSAPPPSKPQVMPPPPKSATAAPKHAPMDVRANDALAQQIADWPENQVVVSTTDFDMNFDPDVIKTFLIHAARFVLRNTPNAGKTEVRDLLQRPQTGMYGQNENPPTYVELAVRTV